MRRLNDFILEIPYLFLMKVPYLWLAVVVFYTWPPLVSAILSGLILLGLLAMNWQDSAWIEKVRRDCASATCQVYVESVRPPLLFVARNSLLLLALSLVIGWLLNGQFGHPGWQWAIFAVGFVALYKKALFFGRRVTYILTDRSLGIRYVPGHIDYRLLIRYAEIQSIQKVSAPAKLPQSWSVFTATGDVKEGLLLLPKNTDGFTAQVEHILLTSNDLENLIRKFPAALIKPT